MKTKLVLVEWRKERREGREGKQCAGAWCKVRRQGKETARR